MSRTHNIDLNKEDAIDVAAKQWLELSLAYLQYKNNKNKHNDQPKSKR